LAQLTDSRGSQETLDSGQWVYSNATVQVLLTTAGGRVTRLDIDSIQQPTLISLGEVLRRLGIPTITAALVGSSGGHILLLNYEIGSYGVYFLFHTGESVSPNVRADAIKLYPLPAPDDPSGDVPLIPADQARPWGGLGTRSVR
jgi:hypothetical protein